MPSCHSKNDIMARETSSGAAGVSATPACASGTTTRFARTYHTALTAAPHMNTSGCSQLSKREENATAAPKKSMSVRRYDAEARSTKISSRMPIVTYHAAARNNATRRLREGNATDKTSIATTCGRNAFIWKNDET